jgi:hypothetical protein
MSFKNKDSSFALASSEKAEEQAPITKRPNIDHLMKRIIVERRKEKNNILLMIVLVLTTIIFASLLII